MQIKATAIIDRIIYGSASVDRIIHGSALLLTLSPTGGGIITQYNLIDGGAPNTVYNPINGFDLISGGNP
jgi:hypothetical protein